MKSELKIMDWAVHQSAQYEFFKTGHHFCLSDTNGKPATWNQEHLPLASNVTLADEARMTRINFDVVIVRSPINMKRTMPFLKNGATGVAVVQTTTPFPVPDAVKHIVWNSEEVMKKHSSYYKKKLHFYIPHGFDPGEFKKLDNVEKKVRALTMVNVFKKRGHVVGYDLWKWIYQQSGQVCDIWGHGNDDMNMNIRRTSSFEELIKTYNSYALYFNPTNESAMPRSRGEAAMCGMPIVSTKNYDISNYFTNGINGIITNDKNEILENIIKIIDSEQMKIDLGQAAREVAIKHFHIKDFIERWNSVFSRL